MAERFWGYYRGRDASPQGEFVLLLNSKGSSSCRRFDARSGKKLSLEKRRAVPFEITFQEIHRELRELPDPPGVVRVVDIEYCLPSDVLGHLQRNAGISLSHSSKHAGKQSTVGKVGMLYGVDAFINHALSVADVDYKSKAAARRLSESPPKFDEVVLVRSLYQLIEANWDRSRGRSKEIWRWRAMPDIAQYNTSAEKTLEKAIVNENCGYVNQIPAASGLLQNCEERHICIDLGYTRGKGWHELIELKAGENCDTPLGAAFQVLGYGLLYCFARLQKYNLNVPYQTGVLAARRIDLKVLGPRYMYVDYRLGWLGEALERGLTVFCREKFGSELEMHFSFEAFPADFKWPGTNPCDLPRYLQERSAYIWHP